MNNKQRQEKIENPEIALKEEKVTIEAIPSFELDPHAPPVIQREYSSGEAVEAPTQTEEGETTVKETKTEEPAVEPSSNGQEKDEGEQAMAEPPTKEEPIPPGDPGEQQFVDEEIEDPTAPPPPPPPQDPDQFYSVPDDLSTMTAQQTATFIVDTFLIVVPGLAHHISKIDIKSIERNIAKLPPGFLDICRRINEQDKAAMAELVTPEEKDWLIKSWKEFVKIKNYRADPATAVIISTGWIMFKFFLISLENRKRNEKMIGEALGIIKGQTPPSDKENFASNTGQEEAKKAPKEDDKKTPDQPPNFEKDNLTN